MNFSKIYDFIANHRKVFIILTFFLTLGAIVNLRFISVDNNVGTMLPEDKDIKRSLGFLQEEGFSGKVIIWLKLNSPNHTTGDLIKAVRKLSLSLEPPLVTKVTSGSGESDLLSETHLLSKYAGQIITPESLIRIEQSINPQAIEEKLKNMYQQALTPASAFTMPFIRGDPLGINRELFSSIKRLSENLGYKVSIEDGHFISPNGKNAMLIIDTPIEVTDGFGSRKLINYLNEKLNVLPEFISAEIIAAHLHAVSNEDVIKKDIRLTITIAGILFLLLFLFIFRDIRAGIVFILPLASIVVAINLASLILGEISYFIIGMGVVVAGIAIDYGIHVYIAVCIAARGNREDLIKKIARPITIGALTTISVFVSFFASSTRGYHQLALFSIFSILLCLCYALFLLPHFLDKTAEVNPVRCLPRWIPIIPRGLLSNRVKLFNRKNAIKKVSDSLSVTCWLAAAAILFFFTKGFTFANDLRQFDGSSEKIIKTEEAFSQVWQARSQPAIFVVQADTFSRVNQLSDDIYAQAVKKIGNEKFISFSSVWPSKEVRKHRYQQWENFWKHGHEKKLKDLLAVHGQVYNFSPDAFNPFFDNLYACEISEDIPREINFLSDLRSRFLINKDGGYQMISFFPDEENYLQKLASLTKSYPQAFIVSRGALARFISRAVSREVVFLSVIAGGLILFLTFLLLRNIRLATLSLTPVLTAILAMLAIPGLTAKAFNAPAIIAAMVVVGLSIDYGIFMVYSAHHNLKTQTSLAVSLSAATTLIGAGALLFAKHPVLFSIGLILVVGVSAGCLTALFVTPSLYRLWPSKCR